MFKNNSIQKLIKKYILDKSHSNNINRDDILHIIKEKKHVQQKRIKY